MNQDCFYYCFQRNNVVVLFGTLKVQSFILTEVSDCGLLIVVTSSTFLKRKDMSKEKRQLAQIIKTPQPSIYIDECTVYTYTVYMYTALWSIWILPALRRQSYTWAHTKYPSSLCVCTRVYKHTPTHHSTTRKNREIYKTRPLSLLLPKQYLPRQQQALTMESPHFQAPLTHTCRRETNTCDTHACSREIGQYK